MQAFLSRHVLAGEYGVVLMLLAEIIDEIKNVF